MRGSEREWVSRVGRGEGGLEGEVRVDSKRGWARGRMLEENKR